MNTHAMYSVAIYFEDGNHIIEEFEDYPSMIEILTKYSDQKIVNLEENSFGDYTVDDIQNILIGKIKKRKV